MPFYEKGDVRIHYEEAGSGFPLLIIPGGGLNSTISFFTEKGPFNAIEAFKGEYRCITHGPAQRQRRPVLRPARDRPSLGRLHRRPARPDGSPGHRRVHGDGLLHRRPVHLEPAAAGARTASSPPCWRSPAGSVRKCRTCSTTTTSPAGVRRCAPAAPTSRWTMVDAFLKQDVPRQRGLRLHRDAGLRARLPDAHPGPARRRPRPSLRRGDGERACWRRTARSASTPGRTRRIASPSRCATSTPSSRPMTA